MLWSRCDIGWVPETVDLTEDLARYVAPALALVAVARLSPPVKSVDDGGRPQGEYLVILQPIDGSGAERRAAVLSTAGVVRLSQGCEGNDQTFLNDDIGDRVESLPIVDYLLPPIAR